MIFGKVEHPETVDFSLPVNHVETHNVLNSRKNKEKPKVYVGCAKWNRNDLKGFYPRGTKDELAYYATQFNSIEMNATFYSIPGIPQVETWRDKTPADFKFFPKITNTISHYKRLNGVKPLVEEFCSNISNFETKLGMVFLQLHDNFAYKSFDRLTHFVESFPAGIPLAVELRNTNWFNDPEISSELYTFLERNQVTNIIVDTAGRRDLLHMRLTTPTAFVRWVGANHPSDYSRLDEWVERLAEWIENGLENLYFFIHQNIEKESPLLATHFIKKLNERCGLNVRGPGQDSLF
ncbi:DUF72 domain-containing protein [Mariniphaga sediminis]|uniref:DUF72 domain-containing protein n=2 Tax=Mariniphaga sediminis TaxID=1628158 RepID=A0A399D5E8_9BACT|nr:DUF72 domain-containing protein [Mariniphaga sediminis]RIH65660.1 DUF72 domain-containing protein [Mariniphaga sediminis]